MIPVGGIIVGVVWALRAINASARVSASPLRSASPIALTISACGGKGSKAFQNST